METVTTLVPPTLVAFVERRRAGSVPPRGMPFVERRRPATVHLVDVEDLHEADLHGLLSDGLDHGFGTVPETPLGAVALLAGVIASSGSAARAAHDLGPSAGALLA